ncbi:MAG TPA: serine hydroxymethyltransferase [Candidatus Saccharimonadales bacterium]|nr:serine hydroxymethyltransferase [Candidatus Saccharimonadales bacterium]
MNDTEIAKLIAAEERRQRDGLEMIPSENHVSGDVLRALGTRLMDKYSEGYPGMRYYGGCENVDAIENIARDRATKLFGADHANVQAYSGSPANMAAYFALVDPGDTVMGLELPYGGHMTHGLKVNFSGKWFHSVSYRTDRDGYLNYEDIAKLANEHHPKLIFSGATAYPRIIDWQKLRAIANNCGAWLVADISHIAGLVIAGEHPSPVGIADVITTTTHKTLRGPRGALILCNGNPSNPLKPAERRKENLPTLIDRAIIPGLQGGPHNHQTAGIAVALGEALKPEFKVYGQQIVKNAKALAVALSDLGYNLVTGGTDTHLMLIDMTNKKLTGAQAEKAMGAAGITVNKNTIPFDPRGPFAPSGIRLGTPALTSRGMKEREMHAVATWIDRALQASDDNTKLTAIHKEITAFTKDFPLPK